MFELSSGGWLTPQESPEIIEPDEDDDESDEDWDEDDDEGEEDEDEEEEGWRVG